MGKGENLLRVPALLSGLVANVNFFPLRFGRKKVVVIGLIVAAIANLLVTVIPDDRDNTGDQLKMDYAQNRLLSYFQVVLFVKTWCKLVDV